MERDDGGRERPTHPAALAPWWAPRRARSSARITTAMGVGGATALTAAQLTLPAAGQWWAWALVAGMLAVAVLSAVASLGGTPSSVIVTVGLVTFVTTVAAVWIVVVPELLVGGVAMALMVVLATTQFLRGVALTVLAIALVVAGVVLAPLREGAAAVDWALTSICFVLIWVGVRHVVLDHERMVGELHSLAAEDGLTGLVTRRVLDEALRAALRSSHRDEGTALIVVDLDHFKDVNDRWGHPAGDAALRHVADVLSAAVRSRDVVVSRMGGDELAVLLPSCPPDVAVRRAAALVEAVRTAPVELPGGVLLPLTISAGLAHAPTDADDTALLYDAADRALYAAKRAGRNQVADARHH